VSDLGSRGFFDISQLMTERKNIMALTGIWLPIITPFYNDEFDDSSYTDLLHHYSDTGISGLIPMGTTGESPCIRSYEFEKILDITCREVGGRMPVYAGLGGNDTRKVLHKLKIAQKYAVDGILSVCPYYNRPSQTGLYQHFLSLSEATTLNIIIYNIPYRTGINLDNMTLFRLSELKNIVAVKDSCGNIKQSLDLLKDKPDTLSVLTGEDRMFYTTLANGGDGGILASAHLHTKSFVEIFQSMRNNDYRGALAQWRDIEEFVPFLFEEPNPAPIKYCLNRQGRIRSDQVRLPLTCISDKLKQKLDLIHPI